VIASVVTKSEKHLVYAEDVLRKLLQYPDNAIYKHEIRRLLNEVVLDSEVTIGSLMPVAGWSDTDSNDGDIYD
jgi:hypothetical protein